MNLFKIMQGIRSWAQAGKIDYPGAIKYLNDLGVQMDGIVKQALDNVFKKGKARDPDFGDTVVKMSIDEQGIPYNPKTLTSIKEKREGIGPWRMSGDQDFSTMVEAFKKGQKESKEGVENLFQEKGPKVTDQMELFTETKKLPKVKMGSKIDYDKIAAMEGIDVELIRGKEWSEIMEIISAVRDKADGGRVGFQTGGWADDLTGQAASIYQSMNLGGHSDETIQNTLRSLGYWDGDTGGGSGGVENIINTQESIIPGAGGGGADNRGGGGKWGNLDLSKTKTFTKDVWSDTAGPPGQFGWTPTEVTGYYNPKLGNWQTWEGKNINHAGINFKPALVGILEAMGLGDKWNLDEYGGIKPGSIKGTFTDGIKNPFNMFKKQQATLAEINAMNKKAWDDLQKQKELEAKKKLEAELGVTTQTTGGDGPGSWGGHGSVEAYDKSMADTYARAVDRHRGTTSSNTGSGTRGKGNNPWGRKDGGPVGLATMFTRRR